MAKRNHNQDAIDNSIIEIARPIIKPKLKLIRYYHRFYQGYYYIHDRLTGDHIASVYKLEHAILIEDALNNATQT